MKLSGLFVSYPQNIFICVISLVFYLSYKPFKFLLGNDTVKNILKIKFDKTRYAILLSGIFGFLALCIITYTFQISKNIGYTVALISTTCVFSLILSYIFLDAPINMLGILGIIFIIVGISLIGNCGNSIPIFP